MTTLDTLAELEGKATGIMCVPAVYREDAHGHRIGQTIVFHISEMGRLVAVFEDEATARHYIELRKREKALIAVARAGKELHAAIDLGVRGLNEGWSSFDQRKAEAATYHAQGKLSEALAELEAQ